MLQKKTRAVAGMQSSPWPGREAGGCAECEWAGVAAPHGNAATLAGEGWQPTHAPTASRGLGLLPKGIKISVGFSLF